MRTLLVHTDYNYDYVDLILEMAKNTYMYNEPLLIKEAQHMGKLIAMGSMNVNLDDDWFEIDRKSRKPIEPLVEVSEIKEDAKLIMIKKMTKTKIIEYKPSFKSFDKKKVDAFVNHGVMPFGFRRAHFRKIRGRMFIVRGCIINWYRCELNDIDKQDILDGLETYNATVKKDVGDGIYGIGTKLISYSEFLSHVA